TDPLGAVKIENVKSIQESKRKTLNIDVEKLFSSGYYNCPNMRCDRKYKIKHSLVRHMRHECTQVSHFSCPDCSRTFTHGFNVIRHLQQVHKLSSDSAHQHLLLEMELIEPKIMIMSDGPRYVCSRCGVKYKKVSALRSHLRECGRGAQCPLCPKVVTQKRNLAKHMEKHKRDGDGGETFQILRKILDSKNVTINRRNNVIKVNNELNRSQNQSSSNPVPTTNGSQCPYCRRVYADATAVNRHIKKYCLKEKRFGCIFCQYRSKRKDHIVRHSIRVHDTQLRQKIMAGEFAAPTDAVLKDGKLCEPEGATNESTAVNDSEFTLDFSALYPEITDDAINDDEDEPLPIKTEMLESDDD
ncbi:CLUMA_CG002560, isoform A, partial [Clunio marinus]